MNIICRGVTHRAVTADLSVIISWRVLTVGVLRKAGADKCLQDVEAVRHLIKTENKGGKTALFFVVYIYKHQASLLTGCLSQWTCLTV